MHTDKINNPFDGVSPNFTVFGAQFTHLWQLVLGAIWALALIYTAAQFVVGLASMASHKGGAHPSQLAESRSEAKKNAIAFAAVACVGVLAGAILAVVS